MGKIIAFVNQKGGVGKSTSVFNVAHTLESMGISTLMADLDSQATLTLFAGHKPHTLELSIADALGKDKEEVSLNDVIIENRLYLDLAPSSDVLADVEFDMPRRRLPDLVLRKALEPIKNDYEYILIDCPPHLGLLTLNALAASDYVIIPCSTDYAPFVGLTKLINTVEEVQREVNENLKIAGVVATLFDMRANDDNAVLEGLNKNYNVIAVVKRLQVAKNSIYDGRSVLDVDPNSDVAKAYIDVAKYIISL